MFWVDNWRFSTSYIDNLLLNTKQTNFSGTGLLFAHSDGSGYSVFEEAFTLGHGAGRGGAPIPRYTLRSCPRTEKRRQLKTGLVRLAGIEPTTLGFGGQYSIH